MHILCPVKINVSVPWFGLQCVIVACVNIVFSSVDKAY